MSTPAFSFGTPSGSAPAFSVGGQSTSGFSFGAAPAATTNPTTVAASSQPAFNFGASSAATGSFLLASTTPSSTSTPAFGALSSTTPTPSAPAFALGAATTPSLGSSVPAFNFSTTAPTSSGGAPTFGFAASGNAAASASAVATTPNFAAASAGGFGVGAASSAAGGMTFSFGAAPAASKPEASAVTSGALPVTPALSFGTPASSAATTTGTSVPAFSFQTSAPALGTGAAPAQASSTPAASGGAALVQAASAPAPTTVAAPSAIQGQQVDDIINEWTIELERRSRSFVKHADALAEWDRVILANRHSLLGLEEEFRRVVAGQDGLERRLQILEAHQKGVHDALVGMEAEAERMYREERPLGDDEAAERDLLYERAERVGAVLGRVSEQLGDAITDVNEVTAANLGDTSGPLGKLVRVLNNQLNALMQLEAQSDELSRRVSQLQTGGDR